MQHISKDNVVYSYAVLVPILVTVLALVFGLMLLAVGFWGAIIGEYTTKDETNGHN